MVKNTHLMSASQSTNFLQLVLWALLTVFSCLTWADETVKPELIPELKLELKTAQRTTKPIDVLFVNPSIENDPFWHKIEQITKHAARELNIEVAIIHGHGTRFFQLEELKKYFNNNPAPKYVVLLKYPGHAKITMDFLNKQQVKVITLEQTITEDEKAIIGVAGEKYPNWLGEIYFNNKVAGYTLAQALISTASHTNKEVVVAGIAGHYGSESTLRNQGLRNAVNESSAQLAQIVHAGWSFEDAYTKTLKLLKRYPNINVIWCASDHMALGAVKAIKETGKRVGVDIVVGGFDWTQQAINSVYNKELTASVGGHFLMGAIAIMAIYNEEQGKSHEFFANEKHNSFELALIEQKNIGQYYQILKSDELAQVNFKKLVQLYSSRQSLSSIDLLKVLQKSTSTN